MPEGPELKTICDNLQYLKNKSVNNISILSGRYTKVNAFPDNLNDLINSLPLKIEYIKVKGKLLYFVLENNWIILNTMGMSGRWTKKMQKHCHIEINYGSKEKIWFCDPRRFGTIKILKGIDNLKKKLESIGPDLLGNEINSNQFIEILRKHDKKNITKVLMNQNIISGCGNYIKSESLYRAKISPHNKISDLSDKKIELLFNCLKNVMNESYLSNGATISTYYNIDDTKGSFKFRVYGKEKDEYGNIIIKEKTEDGRTSHWVKEIQL